MASNNSFLRHLNIWVFGVGSKLIPCVLLTYLSFSLIHLLIEADKRRGRLKEANRMPPPIQNKKTDLQILPNSSNNVPLEVTHNSINMTILDKPLEIQHGDSVKNQNEKCLSKEPQQPKNQSNGALVASSATDQIDSNTATNPTLIPNQVINFDCNNNNNTDEIDNQPLSVHNSMNNSMHNSKEQINIITDQKRNSTSSISKQSFLIVKSHKDLNTKKAKTDKLTTPTMVSSSNQTPTQTTQSSTVYQNDRTTKMLISVLLIFLLCEFPSGILILLSSIIGESFFNDIYLPLGNIIDLLALLNSSVSLFQK